MSTVAKAAEQATPDLPVLGLVKHKWERGEIHPFVDLVVGPENKDVVKYRQMFQGAKFHLAVGGDRKNAWIDLEKVGLESRKQTKSGIRWAKLKPDFRRTYPSEELVKFAENSTRIGQNKSPFISVLPGLSPGERFYQVQALVENPESDYARYLKQYTGLNPITVSTLPARKGKPLPQTPSTDMIVGKVQATQALNSSLYYGVYLAYDKDSLQDNSKMLALLEEEISPVPGLEIDYLRQGIITKERREGDDFALNPTLFRPSVYYSGRGWVVALSYKGQSLPYGFTFVDREQYAEAINPLLVGKKKEDPRWSPWADLMFLSSPYCERTYGGLQTEDPYYRRLSVRNWILSTYLVKNSTLRDGLVVEQKSVAMVKSVQELLQSIK